MLSFLKRRALPERLLPSRPERLRFEIFTMPARIAEPAGRMVVRPNAPAKIVEEMVEARGRLLALHEARATAPH